MTSKELEISRRGDEIVLREQKKKSRGMTEFLDALRSIPLDVFENIKETRPPEERESF